MISALNTASSDHNNGDLTMKLNAGMQECIIDRNLGIQSETCSVH